jgi:hypothetical protein
MALEMKDRVHNLQRELRRILGTLDSIIKEHGMQGLLFDYHETKLATTIIRALCEVPQLRNELISYNIDYTDLIMKIYTSTPWEVVTTELPLFKENP